MENPKKVGSVQYAKRCLSCVSYDVINNNCKEKYCNYILNTDRPIRNARGRRQETIRDLFGEKIDIEDYW